MVYFSVIIPLYNKEKDIVKTINTVLQQSFNDYEIVVVNDGSTDNSLENVSSIKHEKIKVFSTENQGAAKARNHGVKQSNGKYIAFLDADDYWYPNHLENIHQLISKFPSGKWFATAYEIKHKQNFILPMDAPPMYNEMNWQGEITDFFNNSLRDCMAWTSAVCMKKDFFESLNGFNALFQTGQDVDLWIRAALKSNLYFSNKISAQYNLLGSNRLTNIPTKQKRHMDLDQFKNDEANNPSLKKYLDLIRYSYVIKFKICNTPDVWKPALSNLNKTNLTSSQRFLMTLNGNILQLLWNFKAYIAQKGMRLRTSKKIK